MKRSYFTIILILISSVCVAEDDCPTLISDGYESVSLYVEVVGYGGKKLKGVDIEILEYDGASSYRRNFIGTSDEQGLVKGVFKVPSWTQYENCKKASGLESRGFAIFGQKPDHLLHFKKLDKLLSEMTEKTKSSPYKLNYRFMLLSNELF